MVAADGVAVVLWVGVELNEDNYGEYYLLWSHFSSKTGSFTTPQALNLGKDYKARPTFATDGLGNAVAAWHEDGICCGEESDTYGSVWSTRWGYRLGL